MDDVRATFETNVFGVMATVAAFADQLIAAQGLVINIASTSSVSPYVFGSVYCASKGAVVSYSRTLRQELRPFGVRVMVVMAGTVRSQIASRTHRQLPPASLYQRVADVFAWRLTFSQTTATCRTEDFARRLVANALAAEAPGWLPFLRAWVGRRDWYWDGGMARAVWYAHTLAGEWALDEFCYRLFKLGRLEKLVRADRAEGKKIV
jgi:1-acylglycerone phosphate reductase